MHVDIWPQLCCKVCKLLEELQYTKGYAVLRGVRHDHDYFALAAMLSQHRHMCEGLDQAPSSAKRMWP